MDLKFRKRLLGVSCGFLLLCAASMSRAATLDVCQSGCAYTTIQSAIEAAADGDTVLVHDGTYVERIDFKRKAITVRSVNGAAKTTIDGAAAGSVVTFASGEGAGSVLRGFTITNGSAVKGGGILCQSSAPSVMKCVITGNRATNGGGIYSVTYGPGLIYCVVSGNSADESGGGIFCDNAYGISITNCTVSGNTAGIAGGGFRFTDTLVPYVKNCSITGNFAVLGGGAASRDSNPQFVTSTFSGNRAGWGGGIYTEGTADVSNEASVLGCILWGDSAPGGNEIDTSGGGSVGVSYSDVQGGWTGERNMDSDPVFQDPRPASEAPTSAGNYHIAYESPCIDAGPAGGIQYIVLPNDDIEGDPRPQGTYWDMGADEHALLFNGSFEKGPRLPWSWTGEHLGSQDRRVATVRFGTDVGYNSFRMSGTAAAKQLSQTFVLSGSAGDVFDLSCRHKASAPSAGGGFFGVKLTVFYADATRQTFKLGFARTTHDWKESMQDFTALHDYVMVRVNLVYASQTGRAWFDDVKLSVR